jgi:uroporphyrin-3 C-methyltransferase
MSTDNTHNRSTDPINESDDAGNETPDTPERKSFALIITFFGLLLALAALLFAYHDFRLLEELRTEIRGLDRLDEFDTSLQQSAQEITSVRSNLQALQDSIEGFRTAQQRNNDSLQALYDELREEDTDWSIAEVEHLISIANHKLMLEKDVTTALVALQAADQRLAAMPDPGLYTVRNSLASEMNALRSVAPVDIMGISLFLTDLVTRVQTLPIKQSVLNQAGGSAMQVDETLPAWKRLLLSIWYEFKSMFVITRTGETASATLLPDEKYFLYQNLRIQLETARFAVLRRDSGNLLQSLELIESWLNQYFDTQDNGVMNILQWIERTRNTELDPDLPDISSSLRALREYIDRSSRASMPGAN